MRIKFNAPVTLIISLICITLVGVNEFTGGWINQKLLLRPYFGWNNTFQLVTHAFVHANWQHVLGNLFLFLLLAPILEEKFGTKQFVAQIAITIFMIGLLNVILFDVGILGLSGVVFMVIVLSSFTNVKSGEIPLTFILVFLIFVGKELLGAFNDDNISQFAHIFGGILGAVFGFVFDKKRV